MQKLQGFVERRFIPAATQILVVCEPIAEWYRAQYGLTNVHVARNVPEREAVDVRTVPSGDFRARFSIPESATVFIYQGIFGKTRGTDRLLEIFSRLDPETAHLVMMGYGGEADEADIDACVARHSNIHHQPAVAREWIISYTSGADIGLLTVETAPLSYRYALPNKFFEYAHAGVPAILVSDKFPDLVKLIAWTKPSAGLRHTKRSKGYLGILTKTDLDPWRTRPREFAGSAVWETDARVFGTVYGS